MNAHKTFDTLAFAKLMEASGMATRQAETRAEALKEAALGVLATKADLRELELRLRHDLTVRLGGALAASTALTVAILGAVISLH